MSLTYSVGGVMPLPKLAWSFDGTTTDYVTGLTGTTTGTVSYSSSGKYGQSLVITNTAGVIATNYVSYSTSTIFTTQGTQTVWIKTNTIGTGSQYFLEFGGNSGGISYALSLTATNTVDIRVQAVGGVTTNISTVTALQVGRWHHIAVVMDGSAHTVYIDGILSAGPNPSDTSGLTYFSPRLGGSNILPRVLVNGELDDLRIFDQALTSAQVQSIYNQQGVPGRGVQVATHLLSLIPSSPVFMQTFGTSAVPTSDLYGATLTSTGSPTMYLDATRGYVFPATGTTYMTSNFNLPVSYSKTIWVYLTGAPGTGNLLSSANGAASGVHYLYFNGSFSVNAGHNSGTSVINYLVDPGTMSLNQWTHYVLTYDQTTTTMKLYKNAIQVASTTNAAMSWTGGNAVAMCQYGGGSTLTNGLVDNPIIYNRALTATEVSLLYTSQFNNPTLGETTAGLTYNPIQLTGTPLFSQLSQAARTSAVGAFSLRAVNGSSVKAVQVRNGTTSATQDFYADRLGNLLTAPVTGLPLVDWLGGATGYVATWYDQSGAGNDATQLTAANQPIIQRATKGPGYMVSFNGTSQFVTLSADSQFLNGTNITVNAVALRTATKASQNFLFGTNTPSGNYQRFQFGFGSDTSISMSITSNPPGITIPAYNASNEPVYYMTGGLIPTRVLYQNDTLGGTNVNSGLLSVPTAYSYSIGNGNQGGVYYYQGNLFELLILTSALDQTQVTQVYQNQLSYTGP